MTDNSLATQVGGTHYKKYEIQPIEYCQQNGLNYCESNVIKYITRWRDKGGLEDLKKAKHMIDLLIEIENLEQKKAKSNAQNSPLASSWNFPDHWHIRDGSDTTDV